MVFYTLIILPRELSEIRLKMIIKVGLTLLVDFC
jgi:hypothetical protein